MRRRHVRPFDAHSALFLQNRTWRLIHAPEAPEIPNRVVRARAAILQYRRFSSQRPPSFYLDPSEASPASSDPPAVAALLFLGLDVVGIAAAPSLLWRLRVLVAVTDSFESQLGGVPFLFDCPP